MKNIWPTKTLGDLCQLISGQHIDAKDYNTECRGVGYLTGPSDFGPLSPIISKWTEHPKVKAKRGDVLITVKGSGVGKINLLDQDEAAISRQLMAVRVTGAAPKFVHAILSSTFDHFQSLSTGAAIPGISREQVLGLKIALPPLPEQQRVVGILDEAFDGIATAKADAEKNLQNARALFESHLNSVFTQRGPGWVDKSVNELVAEGVLLKPFDGNHGEIHPRKADYTDSGVPFIMASDIQNGSVDTEHCKFISRKQADSLRVGFARDGDVLISHKGTIGRSAIVSTEDDYIMLTPQVTSYRVTDASKLYNRFIRYYFMSPVFQREMISGAEDGATRAYIGITKQLTLRFRYPALKYQREIAAKLDALEPETQRLESIYRQKLAALEELKKSLLDQAFSGVL